MGRLGLFFFFLPTNSATYGSRGPEGFPLPCLVSVSPWECPSLLFLSLTSGAKGESSLAALTRPWQPFTRPFSPDLRPPGSLQLASHQHRINLARLQAVAFDPSSTPGPTFPSRFRLNLQEIALYQPTIVSRIVIAKGTKMAISRQFQYVEAVWPC